MHISIGQLAASIKTLRSFHPFYGMIFLAFKSAKVPVGRSVEFVFRQENQKILDRYYRPVASIDRYYSPFKTAGTGWVELEHPRTTLQRIAKDTFKGAFIHKSKGQSWGWRPNYVGVLRKKLNGQALPAFALATWLFRDNDWPQRTRPQDMLEKMFEDFYITREERSLFSEEANPEDYWLSEAKYTQSELLNVLGRPDRKVVETGAFLYRLETENVGPADRFEYEPSERLNVVTGDNSLGKSFLLDCVWFALTGSWDSCPLIPTKVSESEIRFSLATPTGVDRKHVVRYDSVERRWIRPKRPRVLPGLVIYGRHDGAFWVWDSAKPITGVPAAPSMPAMTILDQKALWDGLERPDGSIACNGLIRDVVTWQMAPARHHSEYSAFKSALRELSPVRDSPFELSEPIVLQGDAREVPTLRMPYGTIPLRHASAGVQRIAAFAYVLVWAWREHRRMSIAAQKEPQRRIVLIVDEIEAHLHPRWQRLIVPALLAAVRELDVSASPQLHLATHSPLVLASLEPIFDDQVDTLYSLELKGVDVELDQVSFVRRGRTDQWLMSNSFGLAQARSLQAEQAILQAKGLQERDVADAALVRDAHNALLRSLAEDDDFWPRWLFWAEQRGVA